MTSPPHPTTKEPSSGGEVRALSGVSVKRGAPSVDGDVEKVVSIEVNGDEADEEEWKRHPEHPRNWSPRRKWMAVAVVGLYTFMSPLPSAMIAPSLPEISKKYGIQSDATQALTLCIFLLSYAFGPLVLSPLSEMYGRTGILNICNIFGIIFSLSCAFSPNTSCLLAMRFLSGFFCSAPIALCSGTIADLFSEADRASAMSIYIASPVISPAVGPIVGGYLAERFGVQWVFFGLAIAGAVASLVGVPLLRETYAPVVRWTLAKKSGDMEKANRLNPALLAAPGQSPARVVWTNLSRPLMLLTRSYVCFLLSLYQAINYGVYNLMFATFAKFFKDTYNFGPGKGGVMYLGIATGSMLATVAGSLFADRIYMKLAERNGGKGTPEMRMPILLIGALVCPVGLLWYGWSAHAQLPWIMPIAGTAIYGFGLVAAYLPIQLYLVDTFAFAASATGAASVFRSMLGFAFPLFGQQMSDKLGYGGSNSLLAAISIVFGIPFPIYIYYKGAEIRARSSFTK